MDLQSRAHWPLAAFILMTAGYWSSFLIPAGSRGKEERGVTRSNGQDLLPHIFTDSNMFVDLVAQAFISHLQTKKNIYMKEQECTSQKHTNSMWIVHLNGDTYRGSPCCSQPGGGRGCIFLCFATTLPVPAHLITSPTATESMHLSHKGFFFLHDGLFIVWFCIYSCCWKAQSITKT